MLYLTHPLRALRLVSPNRPWPCLMTAVVRRLCILLQVEDTFSVYVLPNPFPGGVEVGVSHTMFPHSQPSSIKSYALLQVEDAFYSLSNPFPEGVEVGVTKQTLAIVDETSRQVPLSEVCNASAGAAVLILSHMIFSMKALQLRQASSNKQSCQSATPFVRGMLTKRQC